MADKKTIQVTEMNLSSELKLFMQRTKADTLHMSVTLEGLRVDIVLRVERDDRSVVRIINPLLEFDSRIPEKDMWKKIAEEIDWKLST